MSPGTAAGCRLIGYMCMYSAGCIATIALQGSAISRYGNMSSGARRQLLSSLVTIVLFLPDDFRPSWKGTPIRQTLYFLTDQRCTTRPAYCGLHRRQRQPHRGVRKRRTLCRCRDALRARLRSADPRHDHTICRQGRKLQGGRIPASTSHATNANP